MSGVLGLLLLLSAVGVVDTLYFHIWKLRLYRRPECRWEVLSHAGHGVSAALIFMLCTIDATGRWAWVYVLSGIAQIANQMYDTVIEPSSRRAQGGVPEGEYIMHGIINFLWGGVLVLMLAHCYDCFSAADGLSSRLPDWPFGLGSIAYLGAAGSLAFGLFDFVAFLRLTHARLAMRQLSA